MIVKIIAVIRGTGVINAFEFIAVIIISHLVDSAKRLGAAGNQSIPIGGFDIPI
jgi:hypothetical protein